MIPEGTPKYNDLIDVVTQSATKTIDIPQKDGTISKEQILDEEILWTKTGKIDSPHAGRFMLELKEFERQGEMAHLCMSGPRAKQIQKEIMSIGVSYRRALDAESSSSRRDKHNARSTLLDTIGRNRIEKVYSMKEDVKRGLADSFFGKKTKNEIDED